MPPSAPPPSPQEIHRKLSVHSVARKPSSASAVSGNESDSDSFLSPEIGALSGHIQSQGVSGGLHSGPSAMPPLSSIAERGSASGEDSEEEEEEGGWRSADIKGKPRDSLEESVIKSGYLWKKGERRKTWKKRWFVLRPAHLAYYKSAAEYQLLRLLELSDLHSCTPVALKRHDNTFGLISPVRTYYLQAKTPGEMQEWVHAIDEARQTLMATSTQTSVTSPIPIPTSMRPSSSHPPVSITPSPPSHVAYMQNITSSDSEDASPVVQRSYSSSSRDRPVVPPSPSKPSGFSHKDSGKVILSGYLMKCGSKRRNWRKRWFVLTGEKLVYSGSHMDTKPHRQFSFSQILDALEYDLPSNRHSPHAGPPAAVSPPTVPPSSNADELHGAHTFKIVTTKRNLLLCAPTEEDEIRWLGAVRALIARRSGSGLVPGESPSRPMASPPSADANFAASVLPPAGSGAIKNKVRRTSVSGTTIPEEGAQAKP